MAITRLLSFVIFSVILLAWSREIPTTHGLVQGTEVSESRSNAATLLYLFIDDLHELQVENKMMAEKIELLDGKLETLETSSEEKVKEFMDDTHPIKFFNARKLKNTRPSPEEILQYTILDQNVGDAFHQETGIFTSPCSGVYLFSVQISTTRSKWGMVNLIVEGTEVLSVSKYNDQASPTTTSGSTVQHLEVGDRVWVEQVRYAYGAQYNDGGTFGWNQFSGVLLYKI